MSELKINTAEAPAFPSPLWIVALFIGLSEVLAGVSALLTDGTARMMYASFSIVFPVAVLALFVWLLLKHPANLYGPWQYTAETSVENYVSALRRESRDSTTVIREAVSEAVVTAMLTDADSSLKERPVANAAAFRERVSASFDQVVDSNRITVERSQLVPRKTPDSIPVSSETTVQELLDSVWFGLESSVEAHSYNQTWVLVAADGTPLNEIGTRPGEEWEPDQRLLSEVGIRPGATLTVEPYC